MGLLRIFGFRFIDAVLIRQIAFAKLIANCGAAITNGFAHHGDTICSHIGDEASRFAANINTFIKSLSGPHGLRCRKAKLARGFLLQG